MPGTCQELLKWKFAHMNSVDFRLRLHPKEGQLLELLETRNPRGLPEGRKRGYNALQGGWRGWGGVVGWDSGMMHGAFCVCLVCVCLGSQAKHYNQALPTLLVPCAATLAPHWPASLTLPAPLACLSPRPAVLRAPLPPRHRNAPSATQPRA